MKKQKPILTHKDFTDDFNRVLQTLLKEKGTPMPEHAHQPNREQGMKASHAANYGVSHHRHSRRDRVDVFTFAPDGTYTRYHFHQMRHPEHTIPIVLDLGRIRSEAEVDGKVAAVVALPSDKLKWIWKDGLRWVCSHITVNNAIAMVQGTIQNKVEPKHSTKIAGAYILNTEEAEMILQRRRDIHEQNLKVKEKLTNA